MTDSGDIHSIEDLLHAVADYLEWQKRLGHPGLPVDLLLARRQQERERAVSQAASSPSSAPQRTSAPATPTQADTSTERNNDMPRVSKPPVQPIADPTRKPVYTGERLVLESIRSELGDCTRCKLSATRKNIVFGEGNPDADIMFIGEGPGADEDEQGRPFVGRAGKLLDRWIELGMGIPRNQVYIANIVKCRPPNNRDPETDEAETCMPFLKQQIRAVQPRVIVLLGRVPMGRLLGVKEGITRVHGNWYDYEGIPTMPIFHPSYCLRPPQDEKRRIVWEDLKKVMIHLGMPIPGKK
jgi:DNA polymerase